MQVKGLFNKLNVDYKLFELDQLGAHSVALHAQPPERPVRVQHAEQSLTSHNTGLMGLWGCGHPADGQDVQNALYDVTSRRTVPQVFVDGKFLGGCDGGCTHACCAIFYCLCCAPVVLMDLPQPQAYAHVLSTSCSVAQMLYGFFQ